MRASELDDAHDRLRVVAGGDFAFIRDASALVFVSEFDGVYRVEHERYWKPGAKPLRPSVVFQEAMAEIDSYGAASLCCDSHYIASVYEYADDEDVEVVSFPTTTDGIAAAYIRTRVLFGAGRIDLSSASPQLVGELKETMSKPLAAGALSVTHPRRPGSHGDGARSMVSAVFALELEGAEAWQEERPMSGHQRRMARNRGRDSADPAYLTDLPGERRR